MNQCLRSLLVRPVDDAIKGLPGDPHTLRSVLVVESLAVGQSHSLQFISGKSDFLYLA